MASRYSVETKAIPLTFLSNCKEKHAESLPRFIAKTFIRNPLRFLRMNVVINK